jgi:hypothetical protein
LLSIDSEEALTHEGLLCYGGILQGEEHVILLLCYQEKQENMLVSGKEFDLVIN